MSGVKRFSLGIILLLFFSFSGGFPASAHTSLLSSTPKNGEVLLLPPKEISLQFDEDLISIGANDPNKISVTDDHGNEFVLGQTKVIGSIVNAPIATERMVAGRYTVSYRVVSGDGHVVSSQIEFTFAGQSPNTESGQKQRPQVTVRPSAKGTQIPRPEVPIAQQSVQSVTETIKVHHHESFIHRHLAHTLYAVIAFLVIGIWVIVRRKKS